MLKFRTLNQFMVCISFIQPPPPSQHANTTSSNAHLSSILAKIFTSIVIHCQYKFQQICHICIVFNLLSTKTTLYFIFISIKVYEQKMSITIIIKCIYVFFIILFRFQNNKLQAPKQVRRHWINVSCNPNSLSSSNNRSSNKHRIKQRNNNRQLISTVPPPPPPQQTHRVRIRHRITTAPIKQSPQPQVNIYAPNNHKQLNQFGKKKS